MEGPRTPLASSVGMQSAQSQLQPLPSFQPGRSAATVVVPGVPSPSKQPQGSNKQGAISPRSILQQGPEMPQMLGPQSGTLQQGVEFPHIVPPYKSIVQQGPETPLNVPPQMVNNPLRAALSDRTGGTLLLDAVTSDCGHTFGGASLQRVLAVGTCGACGVPIDPGRLIPNLAVRAAAAAFQAEESLGLKRGRDGDPARGTLPFIREPEQKAYVFPYKLHDRVRVKGNKRTPPHFVGKEAVIVHEGLNGWYTVRLKESGEETRLQYRSLEALSDEKKQRGSEKGADGSLKKTVGAEKTPEGKEVSLEVRKEGVVTAKEGNAAAVGNGEEKGAVEEGSRKRIRTEGEEAVQERGGAQTGGQVSLGLVGNQGETAVGNPGLGVNQGGLRAAAKREGAEKSQGTGLGSSNRSIVESARSLEGQESLAGVEPVVRNGAAEVPPEASKPPPVSFAVTSVSLQGASVQVAAEVLRIRGGAPSAESPRGSPSPQPWGSAGRDFSPPLWNPGQVSPTGTRTRTERRPVVNLGFLARVSADISDDERSVGPSSGRGDEERKFEGRWDETNAGGSDVGLDEERGFGGNAERADAKSTPQKLLSVPERDRCVKSNGRGWRCKLRKAPGYQYCEHHQRNWDGHEKQWKKAFPSPEGSDPLPPQGGRVKVAGAGGIKRPKEGRRPKAKVKGAKLKKQAVFLAGKGMDAYGLGATGLLVHKKTKNLAAKRLERALKDARGAAGSIIGQLYTSARKPALSFQMDDDDYDSDEYDLPPAKRAKLPLHELDPHFLSQKRIEKAQKYKTLVANKEYIEDDRGNLKVLEVMGGAEPSEEELLAQVERVCPELDLESLCSVDITAAVAAVAATGREEAEILLGRLLMRHSTKELALVQEVIDQEKRIVLAKLEALNRRDAAKAQWKKRPFLGFGEGGPPKKKRSVNLVKTGRVPRLFSTLFPSEFGDLEEVGEVEGEEIGITGGVKDLGLEPADEFAAQRTGSDGHALGKEADEVKETVSGRGLQGEDGAAELGEGEKLAGVEERVKETGIRTGARGAESADERLEAGKAEGVVGERVSHRSGVRDTGPTLPALVRGSVEDELREGIAIGVAPENWGYGSASPKNSEGRSSPRFGGGSRLRVNLAVCHNRPQGQHGSGSESSGGPEDCARRGQRAAFEDVVRQGVKKVMGKGLQGGGSPRNREGAQQAAMRAESIDAVPNYSSLEVENVSGKGEPIPQQVEKNEDNRSFGLSPNLKGFSGPSRSYSNSLYDSVDASAAHLFSSVGASPREHKLGQHRDAVGEFDLGLDLLNELDNFDPVRSGLADETDDSESE
ncbi:RING/U-box superfamily protein [Klebsormidium nitens]|uniref:RING/U-box superfamily protein n=1 Tax=Klebsormidium nitens TaxID=105231 RepID=A0A1Y1I221_KLENI|nr:RING/U-box superfamily protein [Klebsormidium nitens]|eukprot:GAQ84523.1 RING/U-box superfamily protein [Klebsormidium nitens]